MLVMAGLDPAIQPARRLSENLKGRLDARDEPGHDDSVDVTGACDRPE
jgi:hypothetical protein